MDTSSQIPKYVLASLNHTATEDEDNLTKEWLRYDENRILFGKLKQIYRISGDLDNFKKFNLQEGENELKLKLRKYQQKVILLKIQKIAAIIVLPLLLASAWFYFQNSKLKNEIASTAIIQEIRTQPGLRSHLYLSDGTEVWLNTGSTINFPVIFKGGTRTVELEGEAYFRVFKNKKKPFIVKSGTIAVTALGTEFNVSAYKEDHSINTSLVEGSVLVQNILNKKQKTILSPNEQLIYEKQNHEFKKYSVNAEVVSAWKDGKLIFIDTPLQEVAIKLNRWFNADISIDDSSIGKYEYTATFTDENLSQVMELISLSAPFKIIVNGNPLADFKIKPGDKILIGKK
ncbi:FecR family protein [Sunxiuqinia sp. A32]|uniref:FecR family protein n=1 Tax=Sunxiuqinia sp. A32 TaxID=3461496 RepID=UPI0040456FA6